MQEPGDRPARPGRPSLLSTGPQAEPERQRILSSLEAPGAKPLPPKAAAKDAQAAPGKSRGLVWGALGLVALVVGAVGFALTRSGDEAAPMVVASAPPQHAPAAAPAQTPGPAPAPMAAASETAAAHEAAAASETAAADAAPSTAAVLNEMAEPPANPLAALAPAPRHAAAKGGDAQEAAHQKAEAKAAAKAERKAEQARLAQQKAKEPARPAKRAADNDVVLLAALMAHIQPQSKKATPAEQLQVCKQYNAAGEAQCRVRVCEAAGAKEAACKGVPVAKLAPET